ncbi:unnamed protein product [Strongylus vulgaris]|uniref:Uncharacterized protein n=1 Tax=Strongylus vulgaris TaxID=40348 RepID=A0A3P7IJW0_STRVU|nr:unnamed protein product [Strongylus vulgaris]
MEKLVNDSHISVLSMRVRIRAASHVVVQVIFVLGFASQGEDMTCCFFNNVYFCCH